MRLENISMEKTQFNTREYNVIETIPFGLIKKSSSSDRLSDEVFYYDSIPKDVLYLFPRKVDSYFVEKKYNLVLEYYPYKNLGEYMICSDPFDWKQVFSNLKDVIEIMTKYEKESKNTSLYAKSMYIDKTYNEYNNFKKSYHDSELFSCSTLVINGETYDNFEVIWERVKSIIESRLLQYKQTMIHGDMCFSNILYHPKIGSRFIDMRGSFGERGVYGDIMYDYAKLLHSVEGGYEFIINDQFTVAKFTNGVYHYWMNNNKNKEECFMAYMNAFAGQDINLIRLIEGLIFVGMCARHYDSKERQLIMYLTGIKNLNEALSII